MHNLLIMAYAFFVESSLDCDKVFRTGSESPPNRGRSTSRLASAQAVTYSVKGPTYLYHRQMGEVLFCPYQDHSYFIEKELRLSSSLSVDVVDSRHVVLSYPHCFSSEQRCKVEEGLCNVPLSIRGRQAPRGLAASSPDT